MLIAGIYYVISIASKLLILPPTFAAPIWPTAGLGAGVLLLWGYRYIPALILGEVLTNLEFYDIELFKEDPTYIVAFAILLLSTILRSSLATYLVNRHLGKSNNYLTLLSVTKLIIFAAIIPTFISSFISTFVLYIKNIFYFDSWTVNFFTWWFGDALGICFMLPIMFVFFKKPREIWKPRLLRTFIPVVLTFVMVIFAAINIKNLELSRLVTILDNKIILLHNEVINKFKQNHHSLNPMSDSELNHTINAIYSNEIQGIITKNNLHNIHFTVYSNGQDMNKLFESQNDYSLYQQWKTTKEVSFLNQKWTIHANATAESYERYGSWLIWWLTSIGFLSVAILGLGLLIITGSHQIIMETVIKRTNEIKMLNEILQQSENRYKQIIEIQPVIFWKHIRGEKKLDFVSNEAINILGYSKNELIDLELIWNKFIHPDDRVKTIKAYFDGIDTKQRFVLKYRALAKNGKYLWFKDYVNTKITNGKVEIIGLKIDITKEQQKKQEIEQLAYYDAMTGLPNRSNFMNHLNKAIKKSKKNQTHGAVLYLDLDRFKVLNDSMGHYFGDKLLVQISQRLKNGLNEKDISSRFGGDEFVILINKQCESVKKINEKSLNVAKHIQKIIKEPFNIDGHNFFTSFSIGISIFPDNSESANEIIQQADISMYASKEQGKNIISYFRNEMQQLANKRLVIEKSLKSALINNEFEMYYQPIFDENKKIIKLEALIRWNHPTEGLLFPNSFIPIAEETGMILELSVWIIENVTEQIAKWKKLNKKILEVSINISLFQFINTQIVKLLNTAIKKHNIESNLITLELTESIGIKDFDEVLMKLKKLNKIGYNIAIDDFGTGYSSLNYLTQMPIDILKLDKSFVATIGKEQNSDSLIETIILMAKQLHLELIVEGVETEEQFIFLKNRECNKFQGFLVSEAIPVNKLELLINNQISRL